MCKSKHFFKTRTLLSFFIRKSTKSSGLFLVLKKIKKMRLLLLLLSTLVIHSCYISRKIEGDCFVRLQFSKNIELNRASYTKYLDYTNAEAYMDAYIKGLKNELQSMGVKIIENTIDKAHFTLVITHFSLTESMDVKTVDDASSPYHGQTYALHKCDADAKFELYTNNKKVSSGYAGVSKEEKLSNKRNMGDYIFGGNRENTEYRHKGLSENIFLDLSQRCGRRTAARITKKITKLYKNAENT